MDSDQRRLAQKWMGESLRRDTASSRHATLNPPVMPTRVLDLGGRSKLKSLLRRLEAPIKLVALGPKQHACYATLSHRWGDSIPFHTTTNTVTSHSNLINFGQLPKSFQHAVVVSRNLGIRYLWIDALCIVQDDLNDWYSESRKMAGVYQNALVNFAAHDARNARDGFLRFRLGVNTVDKYIFGQSRVADFDSAVEQSNLSSRGWVFQERILSRKIIHFTKKGIFFEDGHGIYAENGSVIDWGGTRFMWRKYSDPRDWYRLMEIYSNLDLTYEKDRLSAILGLAVHFQKGAAAESFPSAKIEYCAGLWSNSICQGLLWRTKIRPGTVLAHNTELYVPSWTWASHLGGVWYPDDVHELASSATFQSFGTASVTLKNSRDIGSTEKGILMLKACAKPMTGLGWVRKAHDELESKSMFPGSLVLWKVSYSKTTLGWVAMDHEEKDHDHSALWCIPVASKWPKYDANPVRYCEDCQRNGDHYKAHTEPIAFMYHYVLIVSRGGDDIFERVGIGKLYESVWMPANFPDSEIITVSLG